MGRERGGGVVLGAIIGSERGGRCVGKGPLAGGGICVADWWRRVARIAVGGLDRDVVVVRRPRVLVGIVFFVRGGDVGELVLRAWLVEVGVSKGRVDGGAVSGVGRG